jgi:hypothetical protein
LETPAKEATKFQLGSELEIAGNGGELVVRYARFQRAVLKLKGRSEMSRLTTLEEER